MKRKNGFYWVKRDNEWIVAEFEDCFWWVAGCEVELEDYSFNEIGEKIERKPVKK